MRAALRFVHHLSLFGVLSLGCESLLGLEPTPLTSDGSAGGASGTAPRAGGAARSAEDSGASGPAESSAPGGTSSAAGGSSGSGGSNGARSQVDDGNAGAGEESVQGAGSHGTSSNGGRGIGGTFSSTHPSGAGAAGQSSGSGAGGGAAGRDDEVRGGGAGRNDDGGGGAVDGAAGHDGAVRGGGAGGNDDTGETNIANLGQRAMGAILADDDRCLGVLQARGSEVTSPRVALEPCGDDPKQRWTRDASSRLVALDLANAILTAPYGTAGGDAALTGVAVASELEPLDASQLWTFEDVLLVNDGGLCLDVTNYDFRNNGSLELYGCHSDDPQLWTLSAAGQIAQQSFCVDLPSGNDADGSLFDIFTCHIPPADNQLFVFDAGRLRPLGSLKCVTADDEAGGNPVLRLEGCDNSQPRPPLQSFHIRGPLRNQGLCLTMSGDSDQVSLAPCDGRNQQIWDFYF